MHTRTGVIRRCTFSRCGDALVGNSAQANIIVDNLIAECGQNADADIVSHAKGSAPPDRRPVKINSLESSVAQRPTATALNDNGAVEQSKSLMDDG